MTEINIDKTEEVIETSTKPVKKFSSEGISLRDLKKAYKKINSSDDFESLVERIKGES